MGGNTWHIYKGTADQLPVSESWLLMQLGIAGQKNAKQPAAVSHVKLIRSSRKHFTFGCQRDQTAQAGKRYSEPEDAKAPENRTTKGYAPNLTLQIQSGPQYQKRNFSKRIVFTSESPSSCPEPAMSLKTSPVAIFT